MRLNRRPTVHDPLLPTTNGGDLDEVIWDGVCAIAVASNRLDAEESLDSFRRLGERLSLAGQRLVGLYVTYLLKYRVATVIGRRPSAYDVTELASQLLPRFHQLIGGDPATVEETLLIACEFIPARTGSTYSTFTLHAAAALGLLLDDPIQDLNEMRPHLASWCVRRADSIRRVCDAPPSRR